MGFKENLILGLLLVAGWFIWSSNNDQKRKEMVLPYQKMIARLNRPRAIDFSAKWCGPCRAFEPTWQKAQLKFGSDVDFQHIDWDGKDPNHLIYCYQVSKLPTIIFLNRKGNEVRREIGCISEERLDEAVKDALRN